MTSTVGCRVGLDRAQRSSLSSPVDIVLGVILGGGGEGVAQHAAEKQVPREAKSRLDMGGHGECGWRIPEGRGAWHGAAVRRGAARRGAAWRVHPGRPFWSG